LWSVVLAGKKTLPEAPGLLFSKWLALCTKEDEEVWQTLVDDSTEDTCIYTILEALQINMKAYTIFAKAAAVCIVYGSKRLEKKVWAPLSIVNLEYTPITGTTLKDQRLFSIPYDCLYGMTWRGGGGDTSEELCSLGPKEFKSSAYWRQAWPSSEQTDEQLETFWDTHFPWVSCDHPDEWSSSDRLKSHGPGVPEGPLSRWWMNWVTKERLFIWGSIQFHVLDWIKGQRTSCQSMLDTLLAMYKEFEYTGQLCKYPIHKEFILLQ
jgi:hypothetical protein